VSEPRQAQTPVTTPSGTSAETPEATSESETTTPTAEDQTIEASPTPQPTDTATPGAGGPGFGPTVLVFALMTITLWLVRRGH